MYIQTELSGGSEYGGAERERPCQLMRIGAVVRQPRVIAFDVNNRVLNLPITRHDLLFKIRHRSRLLDFGIDSIYLLSYAS